jgi:hypothetical protein
MNTTKSFPLTPSSSTNTPTIDLNYDVELVHTQILQLLDNLDILVKDCDISQRKTIIQQSLGSLQHTYEYSFNKCNKLFDLAIQYYSTNKSITEFKHIFNLFIQHILELKQNPHTDYIKTSEQVGKFVGKQFHLPNS